MYSLHNLRQYRSLHVAPAQLFLRLVFHVPHLLASNLQINIKNNTLYHLLLKLLSLEKSSIYDL